LVYRALIKALRPRSDADCPYDGHRLEQFVAVEAHAFEMKWNRLTHILDDLVNSRPCRDDSIKSNYVRGKVCASIFNHDRVLSHWFRLPNPACLMMLARVPFGTLSDK